MQKINTIEEYLKPLHGQNLEVAEKIIELITGSYASLDYAIKWKRLTFGINHDFHHWLFAVQANKNSIGLVFHFGGLLNDVNEAFIKGESFFLRKLEFKCVEDINPDIITNFIDQALSGLDYFKAHWKELNRK